MVNLRSRDSTSCDHPNRRRDIAARQPEPNRPSSPHLVRAHRQAKPRPVNSCPRASSRLPQPTRDTAFRADWPRQVSTAPATSRRLPLSRRCVSSRLPQPCQIVARRIDGTCLHHAGPPDLPCLFGPGRLVTSCPDSSRRHPLLGLSWSTYRANPLLPAPMLAGTRRPRQPRPPESRRRSHSCPVRSHRYDVTTPPSPFRTDLPVRSAALRADPPRLDRSSHASAPHHDGPNLANVRG